MLVIHPSGHRSTIIWKELSYGLAMDEGYFHGKDHHWLYGTGLVAFSGIALSTDGNVVLSGSIGMSSFGPLTNLLLEVMGEEGHFIGRQVYEIYGEGTHGSDIYIHDGDLFVLGT